MMTSEQVYEMAAKLNESKNEVIPETEVKDEVQPEVVETNDTLPENENVSDEAPAQETVVESEVTESKPAENKELSQKAKPTHEEQEKFAFTKLKNKERQKREKLIADYESKIKSLNEELSKFKDLKKENFQSDDEYIDYRLDQKLKEQESNRLQIAKANAEAEAFEEINQQRIAYCFPEEKDREIYNKLIAESAPDFVELLEKADPDNAVLSYLDDSDIAPLLIRVMMTKPEIRNEVLSKRNAYSKVLALDNLAKRLTYAKSVVDKRRTKTNDTTVETAPKQKQSIPVVGKVAKSESAAAIDKNDPNYWNNMLRDLNARKR